MEVDVTIDPIQHNINKFNIWKQINDGKVEYGITIYGTDTNSKQFDYDCFTREEFIKFIKDCATLIKTEIKDEEK